MYILKTNTAVRIAVGPLVDQTDGITAETGLTVTGLSVQLYQLKNDGSAVVRTQFAPTASGGDNDMALVASSTDGMYDLELTAAQLNFLGNARISLYDVDGFCVHWVDLQIVSAAYFDWIYGTTIPEVNTTKIAGTTQTAGDVGAKTGFALSATGADLILKSSTFIQAIAAAINELATYGLTALNTLLVTTGIKTSSTAAPTDMALNSTVAKDATVAKHATVAKEATLGTVAGYLDTEIAAILADTGELQTDLVNGGRLDLLIDAIKSKTDNLPASPAAVGSEMILSAAYDAAKTAATQASVNAIPTTPLLAANYTAPPSVTDIWSAGTRTLTSFGTLIADIWAYATRTLTAISDSAGITTLLSRIASALTITGGKVDVNDKTGFSLASAPPTAEAIADQVWDELAADHNTALTMGNKLNAASSAGDPWSTALPGAYGAGTAGKIVGDNINATIASRSSHSAADVWAVTVRTLSSFGTLVADIASAVWGATTRTLSAFGFSLGFATPTNVTDARDHIEALLPADISGLATLTGQAAILAAINLIGGGVGTGPTAKPYTLTVDGLPCADALVIMSTDDLGTNPIHAGRTNALGQITFYPDLPTGVTIYLWRYKTGATFVNPDVEQI